MRSASLAVKRGFDLLFSLGLLVLLGPALLLVALAIRLTSPGPILFPPAEMAGRFVIKPGQDCVPGISRIQSRADSPTKPASGRISW